MRSAGFWPIVAGGLVTLACFVLVFLGATYLVPYLMRSTGMGSAQFIVVVVLAMILIGRQFLRLRRRGGKSKRKPSVNERPLSLEP